MSPTPEPLDRRAFDPAALMAEHPPVWHHPNKRIVAAISCPPGAEHRGALGYTRWSAMPLPVAPGDPGVTEVVERPGFYDYVPLDGAATTWHVNFADPHLFGAYGSSLLAQDELQVAEHPALGALREAIVAGGGIARTVEDGRPTPVLVTGVERRCIVATDVDAGAGRPHGLYGNAFAAARGDVVARATTAIVPPSITNLVAIAAPAHGSCEYTVRDIEGILTTACTAWTAAVLESERLLGRRAPVAVHTGYWGCGAFGGNRILMAALQILAARMAGVDTLAFHVGDARGAELLEDARGFVADLDAAPSASTIGGLIRSIAGFGFRWSIGDGT